MFKVGDRVIAVVDVCSSVGVVKGSTGTIAEIGCISDLGVRWDDYNREMHDLGGGCEVGHGWWVFKDDVDFVEELDEFDNAETSELISFLAE